MRRKRKECAVREGLEETGLVIWKEDLQLLMATSSLMGLGLRRDGKEGVEGSHYGGFWMVESWDGKGDGPKNLESDKIRSGRGWKWRR